MYKISLANGEDHYCNTEKETELWVKKNGCFPEDNARDGALCQTMMILQRMILQS